MQLRCSISLSIACSNSQPWCMRMQGGALMLANNKGHLTLEDPLIMSIEEI
jgi:hypothetical protein